MVILQFLKSVCPVWVCLAVAMAISALAYGQVDGAYLYGTDDSLFFLWRYGFYGLVSLGCVVLGARLPLYKLARFWNRIWAVALGIVCYVPVVAFLLEEIWFYVHSGRVALWWGPNTKPLDIGYLYAFKVDSFAQVKLLGTSVVEVDQYTITNLFGDFCLYVLGLLPTLLLFGALLTMMGILIWRTMRSKDKFTRFVCGYILLYFTSNILVNTLFALNASPFIPSLFVFVSYSPKYQLLWGLLLGVVLGLLRQRELTNISKKEPNLPIL